MGWYFLIFSFMISDIYLLDRIDSPDLLRHMFDPYGCQLLCVMRRSMVSREEKLKKIVVLNEVSLFSTGSFVLIHTDTILSESFKQLPSVADSGASSWSNSCVHPSRIIFSISSMSNSASFAAFKSFFKRFCFSSNCAIFMFCCFNSVCNFLLSCCDSCR